MYFHAFTYEPYFPVWLAAQCKKPVHTHEEIVDKAGNKEGGKADQNARACKEWGESHMIPVVGRHVFLLTDFRLSTTPKL